MLFLCEGKVTRCLCTEQQLTIGLCVCFGFRGCFLMRKRRTRKSFRKFASWYPLSIPDPREKTLVFFSWSVENISVSCYVTLHRKFRILKGFYLQVCYSLADGRNKIKMLKKLLYFNDSTEVLFHGVTVFVNENAVIV